MNLVQNLIELGITYDWRCPLKRLKALKYQVSYVIMT